MATAADRQDLFPRQRADEIWRACIFKPGEDECRAIPLDLRVTQNRFHSGRLEQNRREICDMFPLLPDYYTSPPEPKPITDRRWDECHAMWLHAQSHGGGMTYTPILQLALAMGRALIMTPYDVYPKLEGGDPLIVVFTEKYSRVWWDRLLRDGEGRIDVGLELMTRVERV